MGSDYVVRLSGDSSNLQNTLTQVQKKMQETGAAASKLEDIQKQFEKTANSSAPLRKRIADIKRQMEQMAVAGVDTTEEGQKMWETLRATAKQYQATLDKVNEAAKQEVVVVEEQKSASEQLREKISSLRKEMEEMALDGQDGSPMFSEMAKQLKELQDKAKKAQDAVNAAAKQGTTGMQEEKSASEQLKESISKLRKEMEEMALAGQAKTPMFDDMAKQLQELEEKAKKAKDAVNEAASGGNSDSGGGSPKFDLKGMGQEMADKLGVGKAFGAITAAANPATLAITAVGGTMIAAGKAAADFEVHLDDLQALTQASDADIKKMGDTSLVLSKKFGKSAGDIVDSMGLIGSQAPELLADGEALAFVTDAAMTLGGAGSIAVEDAAKAITTVMNQMGVAGDEAMNIANTIEAAEQKGSASVAYLSTAIEKSGTMAKKAGLSYVELAAMVETVGPTFSSADVAGTGLQGTLLALTSQANNDFNPAIVGMEKALDNLSAAHLSNAEMTKLVGASNITMLSTMIDGREEFARFQKEIDGTTAAEDAAASKMDNMAGMVAKLKSTWDAFLITLGQSGVIQGIADNIMKVMSALGEVIDVISEVIDAFDDFGGEGLDAINPLQIQLDYLITIIKAVGEVLVVIVKIFSKAFQQIQGFVGDCTDWIGEKWANLKKSLGDVAFAKFIIHAFDTIMNKVGAVISKIKQWWNDLKKSLGIEVKAEGPDKPKGSTPAQRKAAEAETKKAIAEDQRKRNEEAAARATTSGKGKGSKSGGSSATRTEKIDYLVSVDDGSLDTAEKKLSAFQSKKKSLPLTATAEIAKADEEVKKWTAEVERRKIALDVEGGAEGLRRLDELNNALAALKDKKATISASVKGDDKVEALNGELDKVKDRKANVNVGMDIEAPDKVVVPVSADTSTIDTEIKEIERQILRQKIHLGIVTKVEEGSVNDLEDKVKKLEGEKTLLVNTKADPEGIREIDEEIKSLRDQLKTEKIRVGLAPDPNSLNGIKESIKELEGQLALSLNSDLDPEGIRDIVNQLDDLRKKEREKSIELGVTTVPTIAPKEEKMVKGSVADKRQSLSNANSQAEQIKADYKIGLIGKEEAMAQLEELDKLLTSLELKPLELHVNDDGSITSALDELEKYKEQMKSTSDVIGNMGNVFGSLGSAIGGSAGEIMNFAGQSLNAIAQVLPQIVTLITAKQAEAMAGGTASAASLPFPANIAAIASIVATVASLFASLPKFENGGIVGGTSYHGDKLLARVNSGEMILNQKQQRNLANTLGSVGAQGGGGLGGDVTFHISGTSLKGTLRNYDRKTSRLK